jgi:hypothetical protein
MLLICIAFTPISVHAATESYRISTTKEITLIKGNDVKLTLSPKYKNIKWSSSDKSVATINKNGKLTAKSEGKTTITAKSGKNKFKSVVYVYDDYSNWIVVNTNMFDLVRDGMSTGAIVYYEEDYYFVSPHYYTNVLEPKIDALEENIVYVNDILNDEYTPSKHVLTPDAKFIIEDDNKNDNTEMEALKKRLQEIENEKATSN